MDSQAAESVREGVEEVHEEDMGMKTKIRNHEHHDALDKFNTEEGSSMRNRIRSIDHSKKKTFTVKSQNGKESIDRKQKILILYIMEYIMEYTRKMPRT